jgi:hypothetical protein
LAPSQGGQSGSGYGAFSGTTQQQPTQQQAPPSSNLSNSLQALLQQLGVKPLVFTNYQFLQTPNTAAPAPTPQPTYTPMPQTSAAPPLLNTQSLQSLLSKLQQSTQQHTLPNPAQQQQQQQQTQQQDPYSYYQQQPQQGYNYSNPQQQQQQQQPRGYGQQQYR